MENRFRIYHNRNTVIPPNPGRKRKKKTIRDGPAYVHTGKMMRFEPKVCAVDRCVWCEAGFGGQMRVICPVCLNCQYCGLVSSTSLTECAQCGNHPDDSIKPPKTVLRPSPIV